MADCSAVTWPEVANNGLPVILLIVLMLAMVFIVRALVKGDAEFEQEDHCCHDDALDAPGLRKSTGTDSPEQDD